MGEWAAAPRAARRPAVQARPARAGREATPTTSCLGVCTLVQNACPDSFENCRGGCLAVIASGTCVEELYEASVCVNRDLTTSDVQCGPGSPTIVGCTEEQNLYANCTGQ